MEMQDFKNNGYMLILYCIPYTVIVFLITYYFDEITGAYPSFLLAGVLILILFPIYIGLGCWCGRRNLSKICILGTALQVGISKWCISGLLPAYSISNGEISAWFPILTGFIIGCQLIGHTGE